MRDAGRSEMAGNFILSRKCHTGALWSGGGVSETDSEAVGGQCTLSEDTLEKSEPIMREIRLRHRMNPKV